MLLLPFFSSSGRVQELEQLTGTEADDGEEDISMMVLPDYSSGNNERVIHVKNFNINVGGLELLDCADLKLAYGRKVWCVLCLCCCCPPREREKER